MSSENLPSPGTDQPGPEDPRPGWPHRVWSVLNVSLSRAHSIIGLAAGIFSIAGAVLSASGLFRPAPATGEIVTVVQDARSARAVSDATIEIWTPQNALITTLSPDSLGRARKTLLEGQYRLRVSHPRFAAEVRQVQVLAGQTAEVRVRLRAVSSAARQKTGGAVSHAVSTFRRMLGL